MTITDIAKIVHETNRAYCESIKDFSQVLWDFAPMWQRDSVINGVKFALKNPDITPEQSHYNWHKHKLNAQWKYGPVKDVEKKEHPCMVPYDQLPNQQKVKDKLFTAIVGILAKEIENADAVEPKLG